VIGVIDLAKEWTEEKHRRSWQRKSKAIAFCVVGVLTLVSAHEDEKDKAEQKAAGQKSEGQVEAANKAQSDMHSRREWRITRQRWRSTSCTVISR
jgi:hypothetical protein